MKKLLGILSSLAIIVIANSTAVACTAKNNFDVRFTVISGSIQSAQTIHDKGFNESVYKGVQNFVHDPNPKGVNEPNKEPFYIAPEVNTNAGNIQAYKIAKNIGVQYLVLSNYLHAPTLSEASKLLPYVIQNDSPNKDNLKNVVGLTYASGESGLSAGIIGSAYLSSFPDNVIGNRIMGTFGGFDSPYVVGNYMLGFLAGISLWDFITNDENQTANYSDLYKYFTDFTKVFNNGNTTPKYVNIPKSQGSIEPNGLPRLSITTPVNASNWFSGSFSVGAGVTISRALASDGAEIIFPVAGTEILDSASVLTSNLFYHSYNKIIGVDSDARAILNNQIVLTSALKKVGLAVKQSLQNIIFGDKTWLGKTETSYNTKHFDWNGIESAPNLGVNDKIVSEVEHLSLPNQQPNEYNPLYVWFNTRCNYYFNDHPNQIQNWGAVNNLFLKTNIGEKLAKEQYEQQ